nr:hypothetical protein [Actinomycetota bacterium]
MADPYRNPDSKHDTTRRWVKVAGVIVLVVALLIIVMMVVGGGEHGPGRHTGGVTEDQVPPSDHTPPVQHP